MNLLWAIAVYLLALFGVIAALRLAIHLVPQLPRAVLRDEASRNHTIDGLRGIAAMTVMIHHALLSHGFALKLAPGAPPGERLFNHFVLQLGSIPVTLFFMITAFLFCGRLVRRRGALDVKGLVRGRLWRIVPLYLFLIVILIEIAFFESGGRLLVPPALFARQLGEALSFNFFPLTRLNAMADPMSVIGPIWTLRYEWMFYAALPFLAFAQRRTGSVLALYAGLFAISYFGSYFFYPFIGGLVAYQLAQFRSPRVMLVWQVLAVIGLLADIALYDASRGSRQTLLLIPLFVAIVQGHRWMALLGRRELRFLGEISYSIYLMHGTVLYVGIKWIIGADRFAALPALEFVATTAAMGAALIAVATCTFLLVERPTMHWGARRRARPQAHPGTSDSDRFGRRYLRTGDA